MGPLGMEQRSRILTLDSNVMIAALKEDEPHSDHCAEILEKVPDLFVLSEPSVIYQEVCGTLARKAGADEEKEANTPFAGENAKNL